MANARVGDIGIKIVFETKEDLSSATIHKLIYRKPDGVVGEWPGTVDGTKVTYTTISISDFSIMGTWTMQAYIETPTRKAHSEYAKFEIAANLG